tara:strand:+ start:561 stop:716 length:156 start_codon:yes stop_codon:yes gene_type:complete
MKTITLKLSETQLTTVEEIFDSLLLDNDVDKEIDTLYNDLLDQAYYSEENQ